TVLCLRRNELAQTRAQFIAHATKDCKPRRLIARRRSRVIKTPMDALRRSRKDGAMLARVIADRDHVIERLSDELINRLRALRRDVYADLPHRRYRFRPHTRRLRARAEDLEARAAIVAQQPFGHLAARRVAGAENPD